MKKLSWQQTNPEKYNAYRKKWYEKNKERIKAYVKQWRKDNPELYRAQIDRTHAKNYARHYAALKAKRIANIKPRECINCKKMFKPESDAKHICSEQCQVEHKAFLMHKFYTENKERLRAYKAMKQREYTKAKLLLRR